MTTVSLLYMCGHALAGQSGAGGTATSSRAERVVHGDAVRNALIHPDRPLADRARDADRRPAEILRFFGIGRGMQVADMMAGDMLRNTEDDHRLSVFDDAMRGKSDRFVYKFRKP